MSKTFQANGNTGVVAVINGDDVSIIDDPYNHTGDIFFHSDFNYLHYVTTVSGTVTFPSAGSSIVKTQVQLASIPWGSDIPIVFWKINGVDACGDRILSWGGNPSSVLRSVSGWHEVSGGNLILGGAQFNYNTGSFSVSMSADIYTSSLFGSSIIDIQGSEVSFGGGKFTSARQYLHQKIGGFRLATSRTIDVSGNMAQLAPSYVELGL